MEEILASIRKIISDDNGEEATPAENAAPLQADEIKIDEAETNDFEDLTFDDVDDTSDIDVFESDAAEELVFAEEEASAESFDDIELNDLPEPASFDEMIADTPVEAPAAAPSDEGVSFEEAVAEPAPQLEPVAAPEPEFEDQFAIEEEEVAASAKYQDTVLTDENTADAAAGALGKLITSMDLGGENTIEALVREMLKPMIKEWLDANLPGIVESKVEAEVQRIARMAR